jgi:opacity protein-like surface antigen
MNSFKRFALILFIVLLASSTYAQRSSGWAMVFSWDRFNGGEYPVASFNLGEDFEDSPSNIGGIGLEYRLTYQWALQAGFAYGRTSFEDPGDNSNLEISRSTYGFAAGPLFYFRGYDATGVRPYLGARLSLGGYSFNREASAGTSRTEREVSATSFGFALFGGADVELLTGLRVGAGYGLNFSSFPESETKVITSSPAGSTTVTTNGPSTSQFSTFFQMTLKFLF